MVDKITTPVTPLEEVAKINEIIDNLGGGSSSGWSLLEHKWTEALLDDESWLLANNFSWHNKAAYEDAYNQLVDDIDGVTPTTETVGSYTVTYYPTTSGRKIVLADQETTVSNIYAESGVAWYYVLDTVNTRFKLPRENPAREELIQTIRARGNGNTIGYQITADGETRGVAEFASYRMATTTTIGAVGDSASVVTMNQNKFIGLTKDSTKSGIISNMTDSTSVYKGKKYLYFYVGQYSQTATEQTAGLNAELFNGKADRDLNNVSAGIDFVVDSYNNGTEWYRLYKSGWVEQGGIIGTVSANTAVTVTFPKPFATTAYTALVNHGLTSGSGGVVYQSFGFYNLTTTTATTMVQASNTQSGVPNTTWYACGMSAQN